MEVAAFEIAMNYLRTILGCCRRRRKSVWPTRAPAPTVTRPRVLHAHRMVRISAHPAKQASTRAEMNASRVLPIRIRTPTHLRSPAALAIQVITKAEIAVRQTRAPATTATKPRVLRAHRMVQTSAHPANQAFTRAGMNASRALAIRIRTPTHSWGPAAFAKVGTP